MAYGKFAPPSDDGQDPSGPPPPLDDPMMPKMGGGDAGPGAGAGKMPQSEAMYRGPDDHCEECTFFVEPNACKKVDGAIDPDGWCKLYQVSAMEQAGPEEGSEDGSEPETPAPQQKGKPF